MPEPEVLADREPEEDAATLGDVGEATSREPVRLGPGGIHPEHLSGPVERPDDPGEHAQRRRLTGAVRPEQRDDLAGPHGEREIADHRRTVVAGSQSRDLDKSAHSAASTFFAARPR